MKTFRFVILIDVEAESLKEAYKKIAPEIEKTGLPWETSDEWYEHNDLGEVEAAGNPDELQTAIVEALQEMEKP